LFDVLTNLETLATGIPDLVSSEQPDDRTLKCVIKPGFSFLRGTLKLTISLDELAPPTAAAMNIAAQGIGSSMQIGSRLQIAAEGAGSLLKWQAKIERASGLLASIPGGLVKAAADQTIRHAWQQVREKLGEPPPND
jgi:carbon monoxide dehydrogenase subunit G